MSDFLSEVMAEISLVKEEAEKVADRVADKIVSEAQKLLSSSSITKSETTLGVKTGRLRQSLKKRVVRDAAGELVVEVYFDEKTAPHAKFVIQGTRHIKPHPILEAATVAAENEENL
jgi:HK97 gp10 family phage protein